MNNPVKQLLDSALFYAEKGLPVFPLIAGGKKPLPGSRGFHEAATDKNQIYQWWKDKAYNIGLNCGMIDIVIIDIDNKNGVDGFANFEAWLNGRELPHTIRVKTRSGGQHIYFKGAGIKSGQGIPCAGVDIRAMGGYVVMPPSYVAEDGKAGAGNYSFIEDEAKSILAMPAWLHAELLSDKNTGKKNREVLVKTTQPKKIIKSHDFPPTRENAIKLRNAVKARMHHTNCSVEFEWFNLMLELRSLVYLCHWPDELAWGIFDIFSQKIGGNYDYDKNRARWDRQDHDPSGRTYRSLLAELKTSNHTDADIDGAPVNDSGSIDALSKAQDKFALITLGGKVGVIDKGNLGLRNVEGSAARLEVINRADGVLLLERYISNEFPQADCRKISNLFLRDRNTTMYDRIEFNPRGNSAGTLNLWVGETITPKCGEWPLIYEFLRNVLCGGRETEYQYLVKYIAHALQKPWEKPGVMIIMLGGQGIGKGTLGRILQKIWSATYLHVPRIKNVVGDFNGALERAYVVFLDEALFAGDRASADTLKSLVTEPSVNINEKYQPSRQIQSYHRFFSATNAEWFKGTDRDDRRDFVLKVSEDRKGDFAFWDKLDLEICNGGVEAFAHDLLAMDLSGFNVRAKPNTHELTEQKLHSLDKFPRWWFNCLSTGAIAATDIDWPEFVSTENLLSEFKESEKGVRAYRQVIEREVKANINKLCPSASTEQRMENLRRKRGYRLPSLEKTREDFERYIGGPILWDES
ncbi:bifunctional DNA primase/polymerase [Nitrosomonas supralitoralis]|nr:bifunctional DNA primase/polymerase [Nitrosomonas supralitoralis]